MYFSHIKIILLLSLAHKEKYVTEADKKNNPAIRA